MSNPAACMLDVRKDPKYTQALAIFAVFAGLVSFAVSVMILLNADTFDGFLMFLYYAMGVLSILILIVFASLISAESYRTRNFDISGKPIQPVPDAQNAAQVAYTPNPAASASNPRQPQSMQFLPQRPPQAVPYQTYPPLVSVPVQYSQLAPPPVQYAQFARQSVPYPHIAPPPVQYAQFGRQPVQYVWPGGYPSPVYR